MRRFLAILTAVIVIAGSLIPSYRSLAIEAIRTSISTEVEEVNKGDVVAVTLSVNRMPHIIKFEDLGVEYDNNSLTYLSYKISGTLTDRFAIVVEDDGSGNLNIDGLDEGTENYLNDKAQQADGGEEEVEDISFDSTEPVEICTFYFRVKAGSYDNVIFIMKEGGSFTNSGFERIDTIPESNCSISVSSGQSSDASLRSIKINGTTLPDFQSDIYEYYFNVAKDVTNAKIEVDQGNLMSTVNFSDTKLVFGDNVIYIDVISQDGTNSTQYKLNINRPSSFVQENASFVDKEGRLFFFAAVPDNVNIPNDFKESTTVINGYEVPCYSKEGVYPILVYVFDDEGYTGLYFCYKKTLEMTRYDVDKTFIISSTVMKIVAVPEGVEIPEGFKPLNFPVNDGIYEGYVNDQGKVIFYLQDEGGRADFYLYDSQSNYFSKYEPVDDKPEKTYRFFFWVCLIIAIVEAIVIILIVYIVRRFRKERVNPRPRRV